MWQAKEGTARTENKGSGNSLTFFLSQITPPEIPSLRRDPLAPNIQIGNQHSRACDQQLADQRIHRRRLKGSQEGCIAPEPGH